VHEGEGGDHFTAADPSSSRERDGREVGRIGPGDVVGEIALLYDSPRTATVRALTRTRMLGIGREEFLAAATGSAAARAASEDLVEGRLASETAEEAPLTR
jgi:CRP-like cAMP-binding protein